MTNRSSDQQRSSLLFWLGCASVFLLLLLIAVGVVMMLMLRSNARQAQASPAFVPTLPADWRAILRADAAVPPEAAALAVPATDSGDAARVLRAALVPVAPRASYMRLARRLPLDSGDRAVAAALLRDTTVDRIAAAARLRSYDAVPLLLADTTTIPVFDTRLPVLPLWNSGFRAIQMLLARGAARENAGRLDLARADYRAGLALALAMFRGEPSITGSVQGLQYVIDAARSLEALAGRDSAAAASARHVEAWATRVRGDAFRIVAALAHTPDSLHAAVADTTLPFPVRAEAVHDCANRFLVDGPWDVYRGPSRADYRAVRAAEHDRGLGALALEYDTIMSRLDRVGGWTRLQWYLHGRR